LHQPKFSSPADNCSLDDDELFDTRTESPAPESPLLAAALRAREQQEQGVAIVVNSTGGRHDFNGHTQYDATPSHLLTVHQPATEYSYDEYSIEEEDLFDVPCTQPPSRKPLLEAALKAREQHATTDRLVKSYSHIETSAIVNMTLVRNNNEMLKSSSMHNERTGQDETKEEINDDDEEEEEEQYEYDEYEVPMSGEDGEVEAGVGGGEEVQSQDTSLAQALSSSSEYTEVTVEE
jgi:hypothetical protein